MKLPLPSLRLLLVVISIAGGGSLCTQALAQGSDKTATQLETLTKKIEEQNLKIDTLSQQLLKLEQQIANIRPGVMIGESPSATGSGAPAPAAAAASTPTPSGNAHVVTKGETLTSIAKAHKVGVQELQRFNHIENDRALQIGQTIMIPTSGSSPAASASPSPNQ